MTEGNSLTDKQVADQIRAEMTLLLEQACDQINKGRAHGMAVNFEIKVSPESAAVGHITITKHL